MYNKYGGTGEEGEVWKITHISSLLHLYDPNMATSFYVVGILASCTASGTLRKERAPRDRTPKTLLYGGRKPMHKYVRGKAEERRRKLANSLLFF